MRLHLLSGRCRLRVACMQDMPEGLHGIFPVLHNGRVYIAGGGTRAAFSQSTAVYEYTPEGAVPGPSTPLTPAPLK